MGVRSDSGWGAGVGGIQGGASGNLLTRAFPGVSTTLRGTAEDLTDQFEKGQYARAVGTLGRNTFGMLPMSLADDVVGGAWRSLRNPAEDFGRGLLGMEPRTVSATPPPSTPASPAPGPAPNPTDQRLADGAAKSPGTPTLANITRVGNSYSGAPNIAGDITVNGATPGGGGVSAQNMAAADALAGQQSLRGAGAVAPGTGRPVLQPAPNSDNSWQARNNLRNLEVSASSITNQKRWGGEGGRSADVLAYQQALAADIGLRGGMDPGSVARTNATAAMYGDDQRADATRYTSDNSLRGQLASSNATRAATVAKMRYDMMKDGLEQSNKDRDYAASRNDAANKRQEETLKSLAAGPDGKIDEAKLASLRAQSTAFLGSAVEAARKRGDNATAAKLEVEGPSALGPAEQRRYQAAQKLDEIARQSNGLAPWKGNYRATDNPGSRQVADIDKGMIWDMAVMSDGTRVPANSLRYANGGALSGMNPYRVPTTEFESIDPKGLLRRP